MLIARVRRNQPLWLTVKCGNGKDCQWGMDSFPPSSALASLPDTLAEEN